ncbi:MAG: DUF11 domain-containing protein [Pyrinomonadaceae bacterium]
MRLPLSRANHFPVIAFLCLGIALFAQGCNRGPCGGDVYSCEATLPVPGTYAVTYQTPGEQSLTTIEVDSFGGTIAVCDCSGIVGDPVLISPAKADLSVSIADSPDPLSVGDTLTYNIVVHNNGPFDASNGARLVDTLPLELNFVSVSSSGANCSYSPSSRDVICELDALALRSGHGFNIALITEVAFPPLDAQAKNAATINITLGDVIDPNPANNTAAATTTVRSGPGPDLGVTITDSPDPVDGENLTYLITVTNHGPEASSGGTLTDYLPPGVDLFSSSEGCFLSGQVITCSVRALINGDSATIEIVVTPTVAGTITNTVVITGNEFDVNQANDEAIANTTVVHPALTSDLAVTMSDSPDPVVAGQSLTYTITITNNGLATAKGITLTDTLPPGVNFHGNPNCHPDGAGRIICNVGDLPNGGFASVALGFTPTVAGNITNTVNVTALQIDSNAANNTATETTTVSEAAPTADLSVTISDSPDPVVVNQPLTYNITVTNNGLATATEIALTDALPSGVSFVASTGCQLGSNNIVTCNPFSLVNGASATFTITVTPTAAGTISNTVSVTALEIDPNGANNTATETTDVSEPGTSADLSVTISDSPDPVLVNQQLTYNITVTNNGLATATGITLTDTLPSGVSFISNPDCRLGSNNTITCIPFSLPNGASGTVILVVTPAAAGIISNTISVTAAESDPNTANNTATETTTVSEPAPAADLSLTISDSPDPGMVNNQLSYAIGITNNGPGIATGITLTDTLPSGVTFIPNADCHLVESNTVTCNSASLAVGATATFTISVIPTTAGTITNAVSVTAVEPDPNTSNNTVNEATNVEPQPADLSVTLSDTPDPIVVNEQLVYGITVTNHGPGIATNVILTDALPSGVSFIANPNCQLAGRTVTCGPVNLLSGASQTFAIAVVPTTIGTITSTVAVTALESDPNLANNTATETTTVEPPPAADLSVTISDSPDPAFADEPLTYNITVTNNGPDTATGVTVTDTLPANVTFIPNPDCQLVGNVVTCNPVSLASGASRTFTISVTPIIEGPVTNTVSVTGLVDDPDLTNNSATAGTTVLPSAGLVVTITDSPDPIAFNGALTYTVTVTNTGPSTATNVVLSNLMSAVEVNDTDIVLSQGSFTRSRRPSAISCAFGTLPSGASATLTVTGFAVMRGTITWTATVTANEHDPDPANNTAAENTTVN